MTDRPLIERMMDPTITTLSPHELARELMNYHALNNASAVLELRDAYLISHARRFMGLSLKSVRGLVNDNLEFAAGLADIVSACGYESSGQLQMQPKTDGVIAQYVLNIIKPK